MTLSPASIRNVMSDLEALGLIYAPHVSAGRIPTHSGLRLFVDGLLEVGAIEEEERGRLERQLSSYAEGFSGVTAEVLAEAGDMLSGLSRCAGVVLAQNDETIAVVIDQQGDPDEAIKTAVDSCPTGAISIA